MVEMSEDGIGRLYGSLMSEIKARLMEVNAILHKQHPDNHNIRRTFEAEYCFHQLRRSTELIAISALTAHNPHPEFRVKQLVKEYHPENLFRQLEKLSAKSFPRACVIERGPGDRCLIHVLDGKGAPARQDIAEIYNHSGDRLHAGALRSILKQRNKIYDFNYIRRSALKLAGLLNVHVIQIPDRRALTAELHLDDDARQVIVEWMVPGP